MCQKMNNEYEPAQIKALICNILDELEANFRKPVHKMLPIDKIFQIMQDLRALFDT